MEKRNGSASGRNNSANKPKGFDRKGEGGGAGSFKKRDSSMGEDRPFKKRDNATGGDRPFKKRENSAGGERPFKKREETGGDRPFKKRDDAAGGRPYPKREGAPGGDRPFKKREDSGDKPFYKKDSAGGGDRPYKKREGGASGSEDKSYKSWESKGSSDRPYKKRDGAAGGDKPYGKRSAGGDGDRKFSGGKSDGGDFKKKEYKKPFSKDGDGASAYGDKPYKKSFRDGDKPDRYESKKGEGKPFPKSDDRKFTPASGGKFFAGKDVDGKKHDKKDGKGGEKENYYKNAHDEGYIDESDDTSFDMHLLSKVSNPDRENTGITKKGSADKGNRKRVVKSDDKRPFKKNVEFKPFDRKNAKTGAGAAPKNVEKKRKDDLDDLDEEEEDEDDIEKYVSAGLPIPKKKPAQPSEPGSMPLNKYIAHSGVCSRRDAAIVVKEGKVKVNNEVILDPGHKVNEGDQVTLSDKKLTIQKGKVYILLNKPKDYITTNEDPQGRKTVMDLIEGAEADRLFPIGRLDRNTSGLLLITNDGDLAQKLSHPSYKIKKIYQVALDKPLSKADSEKIVEGIELEDGVAYVDALAYLENKNEIGLEIHSGKNRIVRRIFESLGYVVEKLDRMMYAGLTKKNLPRGKWRYLNEREIILLKHFK